MGGGRLTSRIIRWKEFGRTDEILIGKKIPACQDCAPQIFSVVLAAAVRSLVEICVVTHPPWWCCSTFVHHSPDVTHGGGGSDNSQKRRSVHMLGAPESIDF